MFLYIFFFLERSWKLWVLEYFRHNRKKVQIDYPKNLSILNYLGIVPKFHC